jgi:hypothetical protein
MPIHPGQVVVIVAEIIAFLSSDIRKKSTQGRELVFV